MAKTKPCTRCGEVIFKINPVCENTEVICEACNNTMHINCGEYTTYENVCKRCSNELFKLRRYDYVDKEGKKIDRSIRAILMIKDSIESVENNIYNIEYRIDDIENKIDYMEYDIRSVNSKANSNEESISDIENDTYHIKSDISSIESSISRLKNDIESLDNSIYRLERNY